MLENIKIAWGNFWKFFPVQLLILHFKKSHLLLFVWIVLFAITTQQFASRLGIPYLFLSPEYQGEVSFISFIIFGFAIGGFYMAFHLYSYILLGPSFPFIATLGRPFYKFCINNSTIPIAFYFVFIWNMGVVQVNEELASVSDLLVDILGFTLGILIFIVLAIFYFFKTNWDVKKLGKDKLKGLYARVNMLFTKSDYWFRPMPAKKYYPSAYFSNLTSIAVARDSEHYNKSQIREIFRQNQLNASLFEIITILSFVLVGLLQDYSALQIPAGASIILLFTFSLMILTILYSWFKGWAISILVGAIFLLNFFSTDSFLGDNVNRAYGLSYEKDVEYNLAELRKIQYDTTQLQSDTRKHKSILNKWKAHAEVSQGSEKPKLVIINTSGGGLRSAMWTFYVLQKIDEYTNKEFFPNVHMITGASGGMVGASYFRELSILDEEGTVDKLESVYSNNISKDLLNCMSSNLATHDLFMRYKRVEYEGERYLKDRGYSFEYQLNENTGFIMDKTMADYENAEANSEIPMMVFTPTIINDGRRLLLSTQPMGFVNGREYDPNGAGPENIEYLKLFEDNNPENLRFTTAIRMNATFPYILPMVSLPTQPATQVMDAGIRDNYGTKLTVRYIDGMKEWIQHNTSGVVIVEIRDIHKDYDMYETGDLTIIDKIIRPIGNFYNNFHHAQEFNSSELINVMDGLPIDIISFTLRKNPEEKIALSWHLTNREKLNIKRIFQNADNQESLKKLIDLLGLQ
ncbi:MAG: patatin-like phospholipase family protein [Crocinitomicaceae bacterium]|nr:patatin-like phospholipase family protein [Crocinitomicaceae bacterium]